MAKRYALKLKSIPESTLSSGAKEELVKAQILEAIMAGMDVKDAAKLYGVTDYRLGLIRSDPDYEELLQACQSNVELDHLKNINAAGKLGQWQASAWLLERRFPDKYAKRDIIRHEYDVKLGTFIRLVLDVVNQVSPELKRNILQRLQIVNVEEIVYTAKRNEMGSHNPPVLVGSNAD